MAHYWMILAKLTHAMISEPKIFNAIWDNVNSQDVNI